MLVTETIYGSTYPNLWANILLLNYDLLTEKNKSYADRFRPILQVTEVRNYKNLFCLDGYSMECIGEIIDNLISADKDGNKILLPENFDPSATTLFYNRAEGWAFDGIFESIHKIIKFFKITGKTVYTNAAFNLQDIYNKYCLRNNIKNIVECRYNGNPSFLNIENNHYLISDDNILTVRLEDKKLYCSFNWNPWPHRMALISMLHYYDLIHQGYVTSPGFEKFEYKEQDFQFLVNQSRNYLEGCPDKNQIIDKLRSLHPYYPLRIDDRTKYTHTDEPLASTDLKKPLVSARVNSIFEIICETRFAGEHFFSEKTFNPISLAKPFLYFTSANALQSLHKLGYKSFSPFLDESYDKIDNDVERCRAMVKELKRLQIMRDRNPKDFYELVENIHVIAQYNLEFFTLSGHRHRNQYNNYKQYRRFMTVC